VTGRVNVIGRVSMERGNLNREESECDSDRVNMPFCYEIESKVLIQTLNSKQNLKLKTKP